MAVIAFIESLFLSSLQTADNKYGFKLISPENYLQAAVEPIAINIGR